MPLSIDGMVLSVHGATTLRTVTYDIALDKSCETETFSIAVISDFHVGAGARHSEVDQMVERVAAAKPELILIAGDVCDSASSVADSGISPRRSAAKSGLTFATERWMKAKKRAW